MASEHETGDIIINNAGAFGHVLMVYQHEDEKNLNTVVIHAQSKSGFHKQSIGDVFAGQYDNCWHFRPRTLSAAESQQLQAIANKISGSSVYGVYRAIRLCIGNSSFGTDAEKRLKKYKERLTSKSGKFVSTVTCSEAVILCNQLTLPSTDSRFIKLDAAHCLPRTLAKYLLGQPEAWKTLRKPTA